MTVSESVAPSIKYAYSGPDDFTFNFKIFEESDVKIRYISTTGIVSTPWIYGVDYTVATVVGVVGGTVTTIKSYTDGWIVIYRDLPLSQETVWENYGPFNADILENDLDRCIMLIQELEDAMADITNAITWRGSWITATLYSVGDMVKAANGHLYYCLVEHTSSVFATDLAAAYWQLMLESTGSSPTKGENLQITSGVITIPHNVDGRYTVWPESGAADEITSILGPVDRDNILYLYAADAPVTVIDGPYIHLDGGLDFTLPVSNGVLVLLSLGSVNSNQQWLEVSRSAGV